MSWLVPVRHLDRVDVPNISYCLHMFRILEVPKSWDLHIATSLAVVLRRGVSVHLEDPATRLTDLSQQEVDFIDLTGAASSLVGPINALKRGRQ
ncbi:hypothetical protein RJZ57_000933 [Blastomyces gilchristii]